MKRGVVLHDDRAAVEDGERTSIRVAPPPEDKTFGPQLRRRVLPAPHRYSGP